MIKYLPYTISYNTEDETLNHEIVYHLEQARKLLQQTKSQGLYTSETHQSILSIEQALLYINHFYDRRAAKGIYTLPVPEDLTDTVDYVSRRGNTNLIIKIVEDSIEGPTIIDKYIHENTYLQQEIPFLLDFIEYITGSTPLYFIESKGNETNNNTDAIVVLLPHHLGAGTAHEIFNYTKVREEYLKDSTNVEDYRGKDIDRVRFIGLTNGKANSVYLPGSAEYPENSFGFTSTASSNRFRTLVMDTIDHAANNYNLKLLGNPNNPGTFYYFGDSDFFKLLENGSAPVVDFIIGKSLELLKRNFI